MNEGLMILGDHLPDPNDGARVSQAERQRQFVELAVRAEALGFDSVWLGEHHLCEFILSAPPVVLAAIAARTRRLRLGTAVTLLGNLDPVRAAEDYATVDALSGGRVEIVAGHGALRRTYRDFGVDPADSRAVFQENVALVLRLWTETAVHWSGKFRAPLDGVTVNPRPVQRPHPPLWIGGGRSPDSIDLAARLGLPLMLPSLLAAPQEFAPIVARYRDAFARAGHTHAKPRVGACSYVHVAADAATSRRRWQPYHMNHLRWVTAMVASSENARPPNLEFEGLIAGPSVCGSPAEVVDRILGMRDALGLDLHLAIFDHGGMPEKLVFETLELFGAQVLPELVRG